MFCCPHFAEKKWHRNKDLTTVEFELGTAGSEITELPTKPRGSWRVQLIEKAICLWFLCSMMDLCKRRCLQVPTPATHRTAPVKLIVGIACSLFAAQKWRQGSSTFTEQQAPRWTEHFSLFLHPQRLLCHQNSHNGRGKKKNLNTLKAAALVLSRNKPRIKPSACGLGFHARFISR